MSFCSWSMRRIRRQYSRCLGRSAAWHVSVPASNRGVQYQILWHPHCINSLFEAPQLPHFFIPSCFLPLCDESFRLTWACTWTSFRSFLCCFLPLCKGEGSTGTEADTEPEPEPEPEPELEPEPEPELEREPEPEPDVSLGAGLPTDVAMNGKEETQKKETQKINTYFDAFRNSQSICPLTISQPDITKKGKHYQQSRW
jgi:hypothetical protein